jgi:type IV secretion system protein VirB1
VANIAASFLASVITLSPAPRCSTAAAARAYLACLLAKKRLDRRCMFEVKPCARRIRSARPVSVWSRAGDLVKLSMTFTKVPLCMFVPTLSRGIVSVGNPPKKRLLRPALVLCTAAIFETLALSAFASPLPSTVFNQLALSCAPGVELPTLRAVAAVESHFNPLAVRDNSTHESLMPQTLSAAVVLAGNRLKLGHSVDIGLMQINNENFASLGMSVADAFDKCRSLAAGGRILRSAFAAGSSEAERQAAILITLSRYNTGRPLAGIANGYVDRVIAEQSKSTAGKSAQRGMSNMPPQWDIWSTSGAAPSSWILTTNGSPEIERAGAQISDARSEGRAPALTSEKGKPYELSAYQESEPSKP